jgi:hypothetical protein
MAFLILEETKKYCVPIIGGIVFSMEMRTNIYIGSRRLLNIF